MEKYQFNADIHATLEQLRTPLAIYQFIDKRVVTVMLSDGFCELFGFDDKREAYYVMDNDMYVDTHPDDKARIANAAFRFATEGGKYEVVYRTRFRNTDNYKIVHAIGEHVHTEDGVRLAYVWYTDEGAYTAEGDNTDLRFGEALRTALHRESLLNASYFDFLTGLPSMSYFFELAEEWRRRQTAHDGSMALVYFDLCGMKFYNRKFGFAAGDLLLRQFSDLLRRHFSNENCSRFGSDHFCVFTAAEGLDDELRNIFLEFIANSETITLPVRAGIWIDTDGSVDIARGCDRAKYACDTMRNTYLSNFRYFSEDMLDKAENQQYFIDNLDRALSEHWVQVYYQPLVRSANGRVCDEEALARWVDPERGMLSPAEFVPVLEEARLIYKLDLYVLEQVLLKLRRQRDEGLTLVTASINLSRVDFETCDIVEEIRRRVDASEFGRELINIEITESAVAEDFRFMKDQIERFRLLGFHVWMDDFGSEYSSLKALQSIPFDLIKFDMHFMREFHTGEKSRIILSELIKMTAALGIDTVCEGVETEEQAMFLREVGCTMLQGYFFCAPIPLEGILERYRTDKQIGFENPAESDYYSALGRINLYDLSVIAGDDSSDYDHYFDTMPMAIVESDGERFRLLRCNSSYRTFCERVFGSLGLGEWIDIAQSEGRMGIVFLRAMLDCSRTGSRVLIDEELAGGVVTHAVLKRIATNPVKKRTAVAVAVLALTEATAPSVSFAQAAKALPFYYSSFIYFNLITGNYVEYSAANGEETAEHHGTRFLEERVPAVLHRVAPEDRAYFMEACRPENIRRALREKGSFTLSFRMITDGETEHVLLKVIPAVEGQEEQLIICLTKVDPGA